MSKIKFKQKYKISFSVHSTMSSSRLRASQQIDGRAANTNCTTLACDGGKCLPASAVCNFFVDCFDGTDEFNCAFDREGNRILGSVRFLILTKNSTKISTAVRTWSCDKKLLFSGKSGANTDLSFGSQDSYLYSMRVWVESVYVKGWH